MMSEVTNFLCFMLGVNSAVFLFIGIAWIFRGRRHGGTECESGLAADDHADDHRE